MENQIMRNFGFLQIAQLPNETISAFCNRVQAAGKTCTFCCCKKDCKVEEYGIRDQIIIGTNNETIREKAMLKNWNLQELRQNGMKHETAAAEEVRIRREIGRSINKLGSYCQHQEK